MLYVWRERERKKGARRERERGKEGGRGGTKDRHFGSEKAFSCYKSTFLALCRPTSEAKIFLLWEKALSLLLRQARFVGNHNELVPQFTALATSMIRFGEDKATDGILGVIGLGKKTCYSHR